jgi:hypothetical protein
MCEYRALGVSVESAEQSRMTVPQVNCGPGIGTESSELFGYSVLATVLEGTMFSIVFCTGTVNSAIALRYLRRSSVITSVF